MWKREGDWRTASFLRWKTSLRKKKKYINSKKKKVTPENGKCTSFAYRKSLKKQVMWLLLFFKIFKIKTSAKNKEMGGGEGGGGKIK